MAEHAVVENAYVSAQIACWCFLYILLFIYFIYLNLVMCDLSILVFDLSSMSLHAPYVP